MTRTLMSLVILASMVESGACLADEPPVKRATRVVEGRVLDEQGKAPRECKVMFGPVAPPIPFAEASSTTLDAEGRYRVELADFALQGGNTRPSTGPLRFLALAPGFQPGVGKIEPGPGPSKVEIRLKAGAWKSTELFLVDREAKPVPGAEVALSLGGPLWSRVESDTGGLCRIETPPGQVFQVTIRRDGYLTTAFGARGTPDDPTRFKVPLLAPLRGRVVDPVGKPLAGIRIGRSIGPDSFSDDNQPRDRVILWPMIGMAQPAITDEEGRFTLTPTVRLDTRGLDRQGDFRLRPQSVCFADESFRRLAFLAVDPQVQQPSYQVVLATARQVLIPIEHEVAIPSGKIESSWELSHVAEPARPGANPLVLPVMGGEVALKKVGGDPEAKEWIEAYWPEGRYQITIESFDSNAGEKLEEIESTLTVTPGNGPLVLPAIRLATRSNRRMVGLPAPEIEAKDLDTGEPVRLADFRGKVVLLDFWGYWCGPCVSSMPELIQTHRAFKDRGLVIIGLHDQSVQTRDEYDRKLAGVKKSVWDDKDLPFRVALDRPDPELLAGEAPAGRGVTCKRYDVHLFPTTLVIDRDGKVVGTVNAQEHGKLEAMLKPLLESGR